MLITDIRAATCDCRVLTEDCSDDTLDDSVVILLSTDEIEVPTVIRLQLLD